MKNNAVCYSISESFLKNIPNTGIFSDGEYFALASADAILVLDGRFNRLIGFIHRRSGLNLISPYAGDDFFELVLSRCPGGEEVISASGFSRFTVQADGSRALKLCFLDHAVGIESVTVRISLEDDELFHFRCQVHNREAFTIQRIRFFQFHIRKNFSGEGEDTGKLVAPAICGHLLVEHPWSKEHIMEAFYPRSMDVQLMACYTAEVGLYLAAYDGNYHYKCFTLTMRKDDDLIVEVDHFLPAVPAVETGIEYDLVLGAFSGDWRDAADLYKKWAVKQVWCEKLLTERDDIPAYFKEGAALMAVPFLHELKWYRLYPYDIIEKLPKIARAFHERTGLSHIGFVPMGWENRGAWAGINYFPPRPSDETWRTINAGLKAQGDFLLMMPSGFKWVIKRQNNPRQGEAFDDTADFEAHKEMMVHNSDGTPWTDDHYSDPDCYMGLTAKLCHSCKTAQETIAGIFHKIAELGVSLIQFDQEDGGAQDIPCYKTEHGHLPGYTPQYCTDFLALCRKIIQTGKKIDPDFGLSIENCGESVIPIAASMWGRQCSEINERIYDCRSIALFSYIYHEYQLVLGDGFSVGQGLWATLGSSELRCFRLANALVRGLIPTVYMEQVELDSDDEWTRQVSEAFIAYCRPFAHFQEYLLWGITRRPPELYAEEQEVWHYMLDDNGELLSDGRRVKKVYVRRPCVIAGSFEATDGSLGTVIVNATRRRQQFELSVPPLSDTLAIYDAERNLLQFLEHPVNRLALELEPLEVKMLISGFSEK